MIQSVYDPEAERADAGDLLARFRSRHQVPRGVIHLAGAALGVMPRNLPTRLAELTEEEWGLDLLAGWRVHGWADYPQRIGAQIAPMLGVGGEQVLALGDPLAAVLPSLLALRPQARQIVMPPGHPLPQLAAALDRRVGDGGYRLVAAADPADIALFAAALVGSDGALAEPAALAALAGGAPCLLDVSRAAGIAPLRLAQAGIAAVIGSGAGYLCGGPGAAGYAWLAPAHGGAAALAGAPPPSVLALAVLEVGVALAAEADPAQCLRKVRQMAARLRRDLPMLHGADDAVELSWPCTDPVAAAAALQAAGVIAEPCTAALRFSFAPLLLSYADIATAALRLAAFLTPQAGQSEN